MAVRDRSSRPRRPRRTEPEPVPDLFVTVFAIDGSAEYLRLNGWVTHLSRASPLTADPLAEERLVARLVMPRSTGRDLYARLARLLSRGDGDDG